MNELRQIKQFSQVMWQSVALRWTLFIGLSAIMGLLGISGLSVERAVALHAGWGYAFCFTAFAGVLWVSLRGWTVSSLRAYCAPRKWGLCLLVGVAVFVQVNEPHEFRTIHREPVDQMVGRMLHLEREASYATVGYYLEGGTVSVGRSVQDQMYFYPFLVSVLHDVTGYRVWNGFAVNLLLSLCFLLVAYLVGDALYPGYGGVTVLLLLAGLPMMDLYATSATPDLGFQLCLLLLLWGGIRYLKNASAANLNALLFYAIACMLISHVGWFALFYVGAIYAAGAWRQQRRPVTWCLVLLPLFALPVLAVQTMRASGGAELSGGAEHGLLDSVIAVGAWLFGVDSLSASFPLLSALGVAGLVSLCLFLPLRMRQVRVPVATWALLLFVVLGLALTVGLWTDAMASGGAALVGCLPPLLLVLVFAAVWFLEELKLGRTRYGYVLGGIALAVVVFSIPSKGRGFRGDEVTCARAAEQAMDWVQRKDDGNTLYVSPLNVSLLLHGYATIDVGRANANWENLLHLVREEYYKSIVVIQIEHYNAQAGEWQPAIPASGIAATVQTELIVQARRAYNIRLRIERVVGILNDDGGLLRAEDLPKLGDQIDNFQEYYRTMSAFHPDLK